MRPSRIRGAQVITWVALTLGACDDEPRRGWDSDITFPAAQALIERGPRRLDLELSSQGAPSVATLLEIENDDELLDAEQIEAEVLGFAELEDRGACRGTLALDVPGVEVRFDSAITRFGGLDDAPGCTAFVEHVGARLAEGARVRVEARRRPARIPQEPSDPAFFAEAIILTDDDAGDARAAIEVNVGPESLGLCALLAAPPSDCTGVLDVFGAPVIARQEVTDVEAEDPTELLYFDVDQRVVQVDASAGALVLEDGTVLRVVDGTRFDDGSATSVDEVQEQLIAGERVAVEGLAVLSASAPTSLIGIELSLRAGPAVEDDDVEPRAVALSGRVADVEPELGIIVLPFETDVLVDAMTVVQGELTSLEELDEALAAGAPVRAEVLGAMEILEPRSVVRADRLTLTRVGQAP